MKTRKMRAIGLVLLALLLNFGCRQYHARTKIVLISDLVTRISDGSGDRDSSFKKLESLALDPDVFVRAAVATQLAQLASEPDFVSNWSVGILLKMLDDKDDSVVGLVLETLCSYPEYGARIRVKVEKIIEGNLGEPLSWRALRTLGCMKDDLDRNVMIFTRAALHEGPEGIYMYNTRSVAVMELSSIGPPAKSALPQLYSIRNEGNRMIRGEVERAIKKIESP